MVKKGKAIPLRVPGSQGSQISRKSAHEGGKVVSPTHRPHLPPRKYSWYSFLLEAESTPGPQCGRKDYVNEKIPMTPPGIEPVTFRLVAQCLIQLRHCVPQTGRYNMKWIHQTHDSNKWWCTSVLWESNLLCTFIPLSIFFPSSLTLYLHLFPAILPPFQSILFYMPLSFLSLFHPSASVV